MTAYAHCARGLAEFERELIRARTGEGRARAKARGQSLGRPGEGATVGKLVADFVASDAGTEGSRRMHEWKKSGVLLDLSALSSG